MTDTQNPGCVTMQDLHTIGYCSRGSRQFFAAHGINWMAFLQHGVEISVIEAIDDEMARAAVVQARKRIAGEA